MMATANTPDPRLAAAVQRCIDQKKSISEAARQIGVDRAVLTKLAMGRSARPEIIERVARACGGDVNEWLQLAGYEPIHSPLLPPVTAAMQDIVRQVAEEEGLDDLQAGALEGMSLDEFREQVREFARELKARQERGE